MHQFLKRMAILTAVAFFALAITWREQDGSLEHAQGPASASDDTVSAARVSGTGPTIAHGTARESDDPAASGTRAASGIPAASGAPAVSSDHAKPLRSPAAVALNASTSTTDYTSDDDDEAFFPSWAWISIALSLLIVILTAVGLCNSRKEYAWIKTARATNAPPPMPVGQQMAPAPTAVSPGFGGPADFVSASPGSTASAGFDGASGFGSPADFASADPGSTASAGFGARAYDEGRSTFASPHVSPNAMPYQAPTPIGESFAEPSGAYSAASAASYPLAPADYTDPRESYGYPAAPYGDPAASNALHDPQAVGPSEYTPVDGAQDLSAYGIQDPAVYGDQSPAAYDAPFAAVQTQPSDSAPLPDEPQQAWFAADAPVEPFDASAAQPSGWWTPDPDPHSPAHSPAQTPEPWAPGFEVPGHGAAGLDAPVGDASASLDASGYPAANYGAAGLDPSGYAAEDYGAAGHGMPGFEAPSYPAANYGDAVFAEPAGGTSWETTPEAPAYGPGTSGPAVTPAPTVVDLPQMAGSGEPYAPYEDFPESFPEAFPPTYSQPPSFQPRPR